MKFKEDEKFILLQNVQGPIIYILLDDNEAVYVGQSLKGACRPYHHFDKTFTDVAIIKVPKDKLDEKESYYIKKYKPKYNKKSGDYDFSLSRAKQKIQSSIGLSNFTMWDLKKLLIKLSINTYEIGGLQYIEHDTFFKILDYIKETSEGIYLSEDWRKKICL